MAGRFQNLQQLRKRLFGIVERDLADTGKLFNWRKGISRNEALLVGDFNLPGQCLG
ncbi:hypothetical protein D3C84_1189830 [compost metagenome]